MVDAGAEFWFTVRVRVRLTFEAGENDRGTARIVSAINGKAAALITLRAQSDGIRIFYDGYLTGPTIIVTKEPTVTIDYENYAQTGSTISGANTFNIALQDHGRLVKEAAIDPLSGFGATTAPPQQLTIRAPELLVARVGEPFAVP